MPIEKTRGSTLGGAASPPGASYARLRPRRLTSELQRLRSWNSPKSASATAVARATAWRNWFRSARFLGRSSGRILGLPRGCLASIA